MYILNFDQYIQVADRIFGRLTCWHFNKLQATHSTHILGEVSQSTTRHVQMPTTNRTALPVRTAASLRPSPDQPAPMKHSWSTSNKNYAQRVSIGKFLLPILTLRISTAVMVYACQHHGCYISYYGLGTVRPRRHHSLGILVGQMSPFVGYQSLSNTHITTGVITYQCIVVWYHFSCSQNAIHYLVGGCNPPEN